MPLRRTGKLQETRHDSIADFMVGFGKVFREGVPDMSGINALRMGRGRPCPGNIAQYDKETCDARPVRALPFAVDRREFYILG